MEIKLMERMTSVTIKTSSGKSTRWTNVNVHTTSIIFIAHTMIIFIP